MNGEPGNDNFFQDGNEVSIVFIENIPTSG